MDEAIYIIGGGAHGKVVLEALEMSGRKVTAFLDHDSEKHNTAIMGVPVLDLETVLGDANPNATRLAIGIGLGPARRQQFEFWKQRGFEFATVIHPTAVAASDLIIGEGAQLMAGAVTQPGVVVGENAVLNTGCRIDHDCKIGAHSFVAPGAVLCGDVTVGESSHIGAGAVVIEHISIGDRSRVGAGAAVIRNIADDVTAVGVPAREVEKK